MSIRIKVACINWDRDDAPHAIVYVLIGGAMYREWYFPTWDDAIAFATFNAARLVSPSGRRA